MISFVKLDFDKRTKIVMGISIIISVLIIIYAFYNICIKNIINTPKASIDLNNITKILNYEWTGIVRVTSNKNVNNYMLSEISNIETDEYCYILDKMNIIVKPDEIKIKKEGIDYEYITKELSLIEKNNLISFSTIIETINNIENGVINGEISEEMHENYTYINILLKDNIKISKICIIIANDNTILETVIYNNSGEEQIDIKYESFDVKKML